MTKTRQEIDYLKKYFFDEGNKLFFLFKTDDNKFSVFLGEKINTNSFYSAQDIQEKQFFYYYNYEVFYVLNDNQQEEKYIGEKIIFKINANLDELFFENFFDSLFGCFENRKWSSLIESLTSISDLLSTSSKKEMENKLKGYLGEMAFIYYVMNNSQIPNNQELAKKIFDYYQKTANEKHDFRFNPRLRLEVKSTSGENMNFQMKFQQQVTMNKIELYYGFVKFNFVQKSLGINLEKLTNEIYERLKIEKATIPNHLFINTKLFNFNEYYLDPENIEVYLFNNKDLPNFENISNGENSVSEIKYKLNIYNFLKNKNYDEQIIFKNFSKVILEEKQKNDR